MWKQINNVLGHLSPITYGSKKKKRSDDPGSSGLELSVRPAVDRPGTELRSLSRASEHTAVLETAADRRLGTSEHVQHPLQNGTGRLEPLSGQSAQTATADSNSQQEHPKAQHASSQASSDAEESVKDALDSLLQQVLSIPWISQAPDAARLVLSLCCELAASSLQDEQSQEQLVNTLELVAAASSWQAACALCKHMLVLRALVAHYLPGAAASAGDDNWQQLQDQYPMQNSGKPSMPAHFFKQAVAAAHSCGSNSETNSSSNSASSEGSDDNQQHMQLLASCIVCGEAVQFQREQQASWQCLQQLSAAAHPHSSSSDHGQLELPLLLQTWAAAVAAAVDASKHPQQQPQQQSAQDREQPLPVQWDMLLGALHRLQQQVPQIVAGDQQQRQQKQETEQSSSLQEPDGAGAAASDSASDPHLEAAGSSVPSAAGQGLDAQLQQPQQQLELLKELCKTVPMLLQPADLAHMQAATEGTAAAPHSMGLVVLLRLAASTSSLWLPLLAGSGSGAEAESAGNVEADEAASPDSTPLGTKLQLQPVLSSRLDAEAAAIWQGPAAEQASTESQSAQGAAAAGMAASKGISPSLRSPRSSWPDELLSTAQLWPGDVESEDDAAAITREERTLRCWINSVLHQGTNALSAAAAVTTTSSDPLQGRLSHTYSVDSCLRAGRVQAQGSGDAATGAACPLRTQSTVGGSADGSQQRSGPLQLPAGATPGGISGASSSAVFRSSSAGAAAVAAHLDGSGAGSSLTHTRSISADAPGAAADLSLDGWGGKPAAPTTPTSPAAIAAAGAGAFTPLHAGAGVRSCAVVVPSISSVSSLFGAELRSGVLLLEILELLQPGCVDWRLANRPPFVSRTAQLKALENCQLALNIAQEELGLPLVSMSPRDIVMGRRKIILSLVYQLMRYNTMQLLESISVAHSEQQAGSHSRRSSATGGSEPSTPKAAATASTDADKQLGQQQLPPSGPQFARQSGGRVNIRSSSRKQRRQVAITEQEILEWANSKLQQVKPLASSDTAAVAEVPLIRSFKDPVLSSGVMLLQLLHVLAPELVDLSFVTPGRTAEQRQSNARYALSLADKMGCSLFLVWEDLVDPPQPRMVLVLLASLMYQDLKRQQGALV